jgi:hypothetical protein
MNTKHRHKIWEMRHKETGCELVGVEWNEQDKDRIKRRSTMNMVMNFRNLKKI